MLICVDMILLDNLLQCLLFIVMIDLSRTYGSTTSLNYNLLLMLMIYSWIKIKLKMLIFPISLLNCIHTLIARMLIFPIPTLPNQLLASVHILYLKNFIISPHKGYQTTSQENHLYLYKDDPLRIIKNYSLSMQTIHVGNSFFLSIRKPHQPPLQFDATIVCRLPCTSRLLAFSSNNETSDVPDECPANRFTCNGAGN
jgi:hypothetical protein